MRYSFTLPLALAALAAAPVIAQESSPGQPATATDAATPPPTDTPPAPVETTTPPAPVETTTPPAPATAPTEPPVADPATPAAPATAPAPAATSAPVAAPAPAAAPMAPKVKLTTEQKVAYDAWPTGTKTYFGGLTESRQTLFLRLADADKAKLVALDAAQQETVWASIEKQDSEQKAKKPN